MVKRIWDPEGKYKEGFLKEFEHWSVEVSFRQHTLGSMIIFARRPVEKISDLSDEELKDLKSAIKAAEDCLTAAFQPDRFNYLQLGNNLHHLHFHMVPRYKTVREFADRTWKDEAWGTMPIWSQEEVPEELVKKLKAKLLKEIE